MTGKRAQSLSCGRQALGLSPPPKLTPLVTFPLLLKCRSGGVTVGSWVELDPRASSKLIPLLLHLASIPAPLASLLV